MDDERALVGSSANVPFYKDKLTVSLRPALLDSTINYPQDSQPMNNTGSALLLTGLVTTSPVGGDVIFSSGLDNLASGTVMTTQQIRNEFTSGTCCIANNASPGCDCRLRSSQ